MRYKNNRSSHYNIKLRKIMLIVLFCFICIATTLFFLEYISKQKIRFPQKNNLYTLTETEEENKNKLICKKEHTHMKICYEEKISEQDRERVFTVIDLIDKLPSYEEVQENLKKFEDNSDDNGYADYFIKVSNSAKNAYMYYEDLKSETNNLQEYVVNFEKCLMLKSMWEARDLSLTDGKSPYPTKVNAFNNGDKVALIYGTRTVLQATNTNFTFWQGYLVTKKNDEYVITDKTEGIGSPKGSLVPPQDGFILFFYQDAKWNVNIGDFVILNFDYKTTAEGNIEIVAENEYNENGKKPEVNNNLTPIESAVTKDTIKINLFDYTNKINDKVENISKNYPLFKSYRASQLFDLTDSRAYSFAENIMYDIGETYPATTQGVNNTSFGNSSIDGVMSKKLNENGYPVFATGESIGYLFGEENLDYVKKMNSTNENIDGLFQYNEQTGEYFFDSRKNFARYNQETNKFELYNEILTPNFIEYPFGNFMPWRKYSNS